MDSPRQDLLRSLRREGFSRVHTDFVFCDSQINSFKKRFGNADYESFFGLSHRRLELEIKRNYADGRDLYPRETLPGSTVFDEYGIGHSKGSELAFHMTRMHHPLKGASPEEIQNYPYPSVDEDSLHDFRNSVSALHQRGLASFAFMQMTVWEASWYLRSMEELMVDMMTCSEPATILLDRITEFACAKARAYAGAGIDILSLGDDIGTQNSLMLDVGLWEEWLRPRLLKVITEAKRINPGILIFYHSCGQITPFIDGLINAGVEILNPIQPECMDFNEIHDEFGERVSFWGTVGTQQLLPYGSPEEVRKVTLSRLEKCGLKGGIVIGPTHIVEPEVPWENLMAVMEGIKEFEGR